MKRKPTAAMSHDPWQDLAADATMTSVTLGQVFTGLQVPERQAGAVKRALLDELAWLTEGGLPPGEPGRGSGTSASAPKIR